MIEYNVVFDSDFDLELPNQELLSYMFILYVNITTGEVRMPLHM